MSGGHFNYAYARVNDFCDQMEIDLARQGQPTKYDMVAYESFPPQVEVELKRILSMAQETAELMRAAEWYLSSDYGDDSFLETLSEISAKYQ